MRFCKSRDLQQGTGHFLKTKSLIGRNHIWISSIRSIELLSEDANPSEKFWKLDKRIKEDRKKTGVQLEMSRSKLISNIISLINDGAISYEALEEFSDELKETVSASIGR